MINYNNSDLIVLALLYRPLLNLYIQFLIIKNLSSSVIKNFDYIWNLISMNFVLLSFLKVTIIILEFIIFNSLFFNLLN